MQGLSGVNFLIPSEVLSALNSSYPSEKHNGMFFTMWYGVYNIKSWELLYSTAGHPPALFFTDMNTGHTKVKGLRTSNSPDGCHGPMTVKVVDKGNGKVNVHPTCKADDSGIRVVGIEVQ